MTCTIVSAYYPNESTLENSHKSWLAALMKIKSAIVLFVDPPFEHEIKTCRGDLPMHIIARPFQLFNTWQLFQWNWRDHHHIDPDQHAHTPESYAVLAESAFLVESASRLNPFQSEFFVWCDIRAFRDVSVSQSLLDTFPTTRYLEPARIVMLSLNELPKSALRVNPDGIRGEVVSKNWNDTYLLGEVWGGGATACLRWKCAYQKTLEKYFRIGRFAGKYQQVMLSTYLEDQSLANVFYYPGLHDDYRLCLAFLSADQTAHFALDRTYLT